MPKYYFPWNFQNEFPPFCHGQSYMALERGAESSSEVIVSFCVLLSGIKTVAFKLSAMAPDILLSPQYEAIEGRLQLESSLSFFLCMHDLR